MDYVKSKEWKFVNFYIDDGYSGRKEFDKLIEKIKELPTNQLESVNSSSEFSFNYEII